MDATGVFQTKPLSRKTIHFLSAQMERRMTACTVAPVDPHSLLVCLRRAFRANLLFYRQTQEFMGERYFIGKDRKNLSLIISHHPMTYWQKPGSYSIMPQMFLSRSATTQLLAIRLPLIQGRQARDTNRSFLLCVGYLF